MTIFIPSRNCCFFIPIKTGVYLITLFGLLNKLSGFYGLVSLDYSNPIVVCIHVYSLVALGVFVLGLYSIHNDKFNLIRWFVLFYWLDFITSTVTTVYLSIQWFLYTDHSLSNTDPELQKQHDDTFKLESIVSIVILCIIRLFHLYFAYVLTCYYISINKTQYSKLTSAVEEELNYDEERDTAPLTGRRRLS